MSELYNEAILPGTNIRGLEIFHIVSNVAIRPTLFVTVNNFSKTLDETCINLMSFLLPLVII